MRYGVESALAVICIKPRQSSAQQVCQYLVHRRVPAYITDLPREAMETPFGAMIRPMLDQMQNQMREIGADQA